ncbi:MFS transporter [Achromobacter spanius]|uniref:MFS transporter n=1 Tax=Achromobacter spanius TaxID=217203 RepID=UPI0037F28465
MHSESKSILILFGIYFTHILDYMLIMPLGPQVTHSYSISEAEFGFLVSVYSIAACAAGLTASTFIAKLDRRRTFLLIYLACCCTTALCSIVESYPSLLIARILSGASGGLLAALIHGIIPDIVPFERRGHAISIVMSGLPAATIVGVPLSLLLVSYYGWQAPFLAIALLSVGLVVIAARHLYIPPVFSEATTVRKQSALKIVFSDRNHLKALTFTILLLFTGGCVIPYATIYLQANAGIREADMPYLYLAAGLTTLISSRAIGRFVDRYGLVRVFRLLTVGLVVTVGTLTTMGPWGTWVIGSIFAVYFACMSGRLVPGLGIAAASAAPCSRTTFMTVNASFETAAVSLGAITGGLIIRRDIDGVIHNFPIVGAVASAAAISAALIAGGLRLYKSDSPVHIQSIETKRA